MTNEEIMQKRREMFEEWFLQNYARQVACGLDDYSLECYEIHPKQYVNPIPHHEWRIWNAALDSVVVKLPEKRCITDAKDMYEVARNGTINECVTALNTAGIKTK